MPRREWWQRGPIDGIPVPLQPVAHTLLEVRDSVHELVSGMTQDQWNARPANVASAAFHVRHIAGVIDRLFTYARGGVLTAAQFTALQTEGTELSISEVSAVLSALDARVDAALEEMREMEPATLGEARVIGRAKLPSTVIGCLVHAAEHSMRHVGQLSVTVRVVRNVAG